MSTYITPSPSDLQDRIRNLEVEIARKRAQIKDSRNPDVQYMLRRMMNDDQLTLDRLATRGYEYGSRS